MLRFTPISGSLSRYLLVMSLIITPLTADIMIGVPANHVASIALTGCAGYTGTSTLMPDPIQHLAPPAANDLLDKTFTADIAQYPGWSLNLPGTALNGMLDIATYAATDLGGCTGGASIDATYVPAAGDPSGLTFIQVFVDNTAGTHIDPFPNDDTEPMYYTAAERAQRGLEFMDNPQAGPLPPNDTENTVYSTYLMSFNATTHVVTVYDGFTWGYQDVTTGRGGGGGNGLPEPSTISFCIAGLLMFSLLKRREV